MAKITEQGKGLIRRPLLEQQAIIRGRIKIWEDYIRDDMEKLEKVNLALLAVDGVTPDGA